MFKKGDRVIRKNGGKFGLGTSAQLIVATVERVDDKTVWFTETGTWLYVNDIELETPIPSIFSTRIAVKGDFVKGSIEGGQLFSAFYGSVLKWNPDDLRLFASELIAVADKIEEGVNR